jgi:hypothetical protein
VEIHAKILGKKIRPSRPSEKKLAQVPIWAAVAILLIRVVRVFFLLAQVAQAKNNQNPKRVRKHVLTF